MIYYNQNIGVYKGHVTARLHKHNALEICVGFNCAISAELNERTITEIPSVIILPNVKHSIKVLPETGEKVTVMLDALLTPVRLFIHHFKGWEFILPEKLWNEKFIEVVCAFKAIAETQKQNEVINDLYLEIIKHLNTLFLPENRIHSTPIDTRIAKIVDYLQNNLDCKKVNFSEMAEMVFLSESRLLNLFRKETGLTFREFVQWERIKKVICIIQNGTNIKNALVQAGFTDSSHFNRIFYKHFGVSPSKLLKEFYN